MLVKDIPHLLRGHIHLSYDRDVIARGTAMLGLTANTNLRFCVIRLFYQIRPLLVHELDFAALVPGPVGRRAFLVVQLGPQRRLAGERVATLGFATSRAARGCNDSIAVERLGSGASLQPSVCDLHMQTTILCWDP